MSEKFRKFVLVLFSVVIPSYILWRIFFTLNIKSPISSGLFLFADIISGISALGFVLSMWNLNKQKILHPLKKGLKVDVWIPTINEDLEILRRTIYHSVNMDYPHKTYVLDDGRRDEVKKLAESLGAKYLRREDNLGAKAGNFNNALKKTNGDFIVSFDADFIPQKNFLTELLGYFKDPKVALVQTPQSYYNQNSFQHKRKLFSRKNWGEQDSFFDLVLQGRNSVNSVFWVGTNAILRREAINSIGGFPTDTVLEDMLTGMFLHSKKWKSIYVKKSLAYGLAPSTLTHFLIQRLRWARGVSQILRNHNPLLKKGLSVPQKFFYFSSILHFFEGTTRLIYYSLPAMYLLFGVAPVQQGSSVLYGIFGYVLFSFFSIFVITKRKVSFYNDEIFGMIRFFTYFIGNLEFILNRKIKFAVTPKNDGSRDKIRFLIGPAFVFLVNLSAIIYTSLLFWRIKSISLNFLSFCIVFCAYFTFMSFQALIVCLKYSKLNNSMISEQLNFYLDGKEKCSLNFWNESHLNFFCSKKLDVGDMFLVKFNLNNKFYKWKIRITKFSYFQNGKNLAYNFDADFVNLSDKNRKILIDHIFGQSLLKQDLYSEENNKKLSQKTLKKISFFVVILSLFLVAGITNEIISNRAGISNQIASLNLFEEEVIMSSDIVEKYGNLQIVEGTLSSEDGSPIQLKGLSSHGLQWFPFVRGKTLDNGIDFFNIEVIRAAMYVEVFKNNDFWNGYLAQPKYMEAQADRMIQEAIDEGIYVVISWHIHNDPMKFKKEAMDFFKRMSAKWGSYPNVLFEICNEPEGDIPWMKIRDYAIGDSANLEDGVIDMIRKYDSDDKPNIILVGTPFWSQQVDKALEAPITEYDNIMYTLHFYASDHKEDIRAQAQRALDGGLAIFVTEWGTCNYKVDGPIDLESSNKWVEWMNKNNISWINWALANKDEKASLLKPTSSMKGPWTENDLTTSGKFISELLKN